MIHRVTEALVEEARRFRLAYGCERCAAFAPESMKCSHEYPNEVHREVDLRERAHVVFCKEFELV